MCFGGDSGGDNKVQETPKEIRDFYTFLKEIGTDQYNTAKTRYGPLEDKVIKQVEQFNTPEYAQEQADAAGSDVTKAFGDARQANDARLAGFGIDPSQGRARSARLATDLAEAGVTAGARTGAMRQAKLTGFNALAGLAGRGDAKVNAAIGAASAGGQMAQNGYNSMVQQSQFNQQQQQQQQNSGLAGIGQLAGTVGSMAFMMSSKKLKNRKGRSDVGLDAIKKMPIEKWNYKKGLGDDAEHVGAMAEDFKKATGLGDGKTISMVDAHGVTMKAVQELSGKIAALEAGQKKMKPHTSDSSSEANQEEGAEA